MQVRRKQLIDIDPADPLSRTPAEIKFGAF